MRLISLLPKEEVFHGSRSPRIARGRTQGRLQRRKAGPEVHAEDTEDGERARLREGIQLHIEQTQTQIERVEQAMGKLNTRPGRKVCEAMRGLVEEAQHEIEEQDDKGPILDLVIVAGMQRIEHYEIAAYGTDIALAKALGEQEICRPAVGDA